jgi:hypothetical protein
MEIIQRAQTIEEVEWRHDFQRIGETEGTGYSFHCEEDGTLLEHNEESWAHVNDHPEKYEDRGVVEFRFIRRLYTQGICDDCGEVVELSHFTNPCECGADYNMSGQRLAPRHLWGEETGEHPADVARIP